MNVSFVVLAYRLLQKCSSDGRDEWFSQSSAAGTRVEVMFVLCINGAHEDKNLLSSTRMSDTGYRFEDSSRFIRG